MVGRFLVLLVCLGGLSLSGCGPSKEVLERRAAIKAEYENLRAEARASFEQRSAAEAKQAPSNDPGLAVRECTVAQPVPMELKWGTKFILFGHYLCANSKDAAEIIAYRKWYCAQSSQRHRCVTAQWRKGHPTFVRKKLLAGTVNGQAAPFRELQECKGSDAVTELGCA